MTRDDLPFEIPEGTYGNNFSYLFKMLEKVIMSLLNQLYIVMIIQF